MANQGIYHPTYNPNGSKKLSDGNFWYNTSVSINSTMDCFDSSKILTASGYIGSVSGRPDGLFYDQVHESDIIDLRNSSKKVEDYNRLINREFNKLVAGSTRGKEGEISLVSKKATQYYKYTAAKIRFFLGSGATSGTTLPTNTGLYSKKTYKILVVNKDDGTYCIGDIDQYSSSTGEIEVGYLYTPFNTLSGALTTLITPTNGLDVYIIGESTRTKSNTLLHCDIIGNPTNYPTSWKESGVFGTPLIVAEDGTSLLPNGALDSFKLSRKANATPLLYLRSTDSGATWTSFSPTFSTTTNAITLTDEPANNLVMVYYQTHTRMAEPVANGEVIEYGKVLGTNGISNAHFISTLIGKVPTANTAPYLQDGYNVNAYRIDATTFKWSTTATEIPTHTALTSAGGASGVPAVKVLPYLTRLNGKARLSLVFKEMKHKGTSWGDDAKFNIVDNVSTTTDNNAQTVLIGQKTVELPYFIGADE